MSTSASTDTAIQVIRSAQQHHLALVAMADVKASFLLAASLITLAMVVPQAVYDTTQHTLLALCLTALLASIMAVRALTPRLLYLRKGDLTPEINLLFSGHFSEFGENEYVEKLLAALSTGEGAIEALARDLYQMGLILHHKKQRAVASAYTVTVTGLLVTAIVAILGVILK